MQAAALSTDVAGHVSSGDEVNFVADKNLNNDTLATSRPLYIARNAA